MVCLRSVSWQAHPPAQLPLLHRRWRWPAAASSMTFGGRAVPGFLASCGRACVSAGTTDQVTLAGGSTGAGKARVSFAADGLVSGADRPSATRRCQLVCQSGSVALFCSQSTKLASSQRWSTSPRVLRWGSVFLKTSICARLCQAVTSHHTSCASTRASAPRLPLVFCACSSTATAWVKNSSRRDGSLSRRRATTMTRGGDQQEISGRSPPRGPVSRLSRSGPWFATRLSWPGSAWSVPCTPTRRGG
jgi:hypothetical protein